MGSKQSHTLEQEVIKQERGSNFVPVWSWESNSKPFQNTVATTWTMYEDIESEILEEAFRKNSEKLIVTLDDYCVDLVNFVQSNRRDPSKQRKVRRELVSRQERVRRINKFTDIDEEQTRRGPFNDGPDNGGYHGFIKAWEKRNEHRSMDSLLELAAAGITFEAAKHEHSPSESNWIATKLRGVKGTENEKIYMMCVHLYSKESFLYKMVNKVLRDNDQTKVETLGPYCYLLFKARYDTSQDNNLFKGTVYRGMELSIDMVRSCERSVGQWKVWYQFSSTTKKREIAEQYGNVLFVINVDLKRGGHYIRDFSEYMSEEEVLLPAGVQVQITKVTSDENTGKFIIYLQAETRNPACLGLEPTGKK